MRRALRAQCGFSVPELLMTVAIAATLMAMAAPVMTDITQSSKLNGAARTVERELQSARLKAVSTNSVLRVRTNCPAPGYVRTVEVLGSSALDSSSDRCSPSAYPFPPADNDRATRPNYDGPIRVLPSEATVTDAVLQFSPDGTVEEVVSGLPQAIPSQVTLTITRRSHSKTVTVNGAGKVQLQ